MLSRSKIDKLRERAEQKREDHKAEVREEVLRAGSDVFGRDIDTTSEEFARWADLETYDRMVQHMSRTPEALALGVDPTAWGNTIIDPDSLTGRDRENYEAWSQYNNRPYYSGDQEFMGWVNDRGSIETYHAQQQGLIREARIYDEESDEFARVFVVSEQAVDEFGDKLRFEGNRVGDVIIAPEDSISVGRSTGESAPDWVAENFGDGYGVQQTKGPSRRGLVGQAFGRSFERSLSRLIPREALGLVDSFSLGMATPVFLGEEAADRADRAFFDPETTQQVHAVGRGLASGALATLGPMGVAAAAAVNFAGAASDYRRTGTHFSERFQQAGLNSLTMAAGAGVGSMFSGAGGAALAQGGVTFGGQRLQGVSASEAFEAAAWSSGSSLATSGVNAAVGPKTNLGQAGLSFSTGYAVSGLRSGDWSTSAAFAGGQSALISQMRGSGNNWTGDDGNRLGIGDRFSQSFVVQPFNPGGFVDWARGGKRKPPEDQRRVPDVPGPSSDLSDFTFPSFFDTPELKL